MATNETTGTPVYRLVDDTVLDLESGRLSVSLPRQYVTNNRTLARARPHAPPSGRYLRRSCCRSQGWMRLAACEHAGTGLEQLFHPNLQAKQSCKPPSARRALWLKRARARAQERLRDVDSGQPATLLTYIPERALANSSAAYGLQFRQLPVRGPAPRALTCCGWYAGAVMARAAGAGACLWQLRFTDGGALASSLPYAFTHLTLTAGQAYASLLLLSPSSLAWT